jgi:ABC-type multidrug transport system fused ATPase/permease subunit
MSVPDPTIQRDLSRLGAGGTTDRLRFRLVLKVLFRCLPLLKEVKWHVVAIIAGVLGLALITILPAFQMYDVFWTRILKGEAPTILQCKLLHAFGAACDPWTEEARKVGVRKLVVAVTMFGLPLGGAFYGLNYYRIWILQQVNHVLRMRLLDRLQALSLRFHADKPVGDAIYRMYQDSGMVTQLVDVLVLRPVRAFGEGMFALGIVAMYRPSLAALLALGWPIALVIGYKFSRPLRVGFRSAREHNSALTSLTQQSLQGIRVIKSYGAELAEQRRFDAVSQVTFQQAFTARNRMALYEMLVFWTFATLIVIGAAIGAVLARDAAPLVVAIGGFKVWNLGLWEAFRGRTGTMQTSSTGLFQLWALMQDMAIGLDRVFEVLDIDPEIKDAPDAVALPKLQHGVELQNVSFAYEAGRPVLSEVSLTAAPGTITAIVGPTGSGKSTLMSLLLRLYDPDQGSVLIDGLDVRKVTIDSLRANVAIALQENILFGTTIGENIKYAKPGASDAEMREAARVAAADEFIEQLPERYATMLGERGTKLSTGQRQRLSIARAILKDTPILVLDEPTAALDAETELRVMKNLAEWGRGRAVFIITHRLSTIRRADRIVFLSEGKLLEQGSHQELMQRPGGSYRKLVEGEEAAARREPVQVAS